MLPETIEEHMQEVEIIKNKIAVREVYANWNDFIDGQMGSLCSTSYPDEIKKAAAELVLETVRDFCSPIKDMVADLKCISIERFNDEERLMLNTVISMGDDFIKKIYTK